jgi:two-component system LytT family sensor kinase
MKKQRFSVEQIVAVLKQAELGVPVTRERFAGLYPGNTSQFEVRRRSEGGTEVSISFPLHTRKEADDGLTS